MAIRKMRKGEGMIKKILVPTDGSETANKAIEYAIELARQLGATIIFMSVVENSLLIPQIIPSVATPTHLLEPIEDYLRQTAEAYTDEAERLCQKSEIQHTKIIRSGHPVEEIIKEAIKSEVDLIVIGAHGKSALKAALLGSITFGIINKETKVPVLIVRK